MFIGCCKAAEGLGNFLIKFNKLFFSIVVFGIVVLAITFSFGICAWAEGDNKTEIEEVLLSTESIDVDKETQDYSELYNNNESDNVNADLESCEEENLLAMEPSLKFGVSENWYFDKETSTIICTESITADDIVDMESNVSEAVAIEFTKKDFYLGPIEFNQEIFTSLKSFKFDQGIKLYRAGSHFFNDLEIDELKINGAIDVNTSNTCFNNCTINCSLEFDSFESSTSNCFNNLINLNKIVIKNYFKLNGLNNTDRYFCNCYDLNYIKINSITCVNPNAYARVFSWEVQPDSNVYDPLVFEADNVKSECLFFDACNSLSSVKIDTDFVQWGNNTVSFNNCNGLTDVEINGAVQVSINYGPCSAFVNCSKLSSLQIGGDVSVDAQCHLFHGPTSLKEATFNGNVSVCDSNATMFAADSVIDTESECVVTFNGKVETRNAGVIFSEKSGTECKEIIFNDECNLFGLNFIKLKKLVSIRGDSNKIYFQNASDVVECNKLEEIDLPNAELKIDLGASFCSSCESLKSVHLASLNSIQICFSDNMSLESFELTGDMYIATGGSLCNNPALKTIKIGGKAQASGSILINVPSLSVFEVSNSINFNSGFYCTEDQPNTSLKILKIPSESNIILRFAWFTALEEISFGTSLKALLPSDFIFEGDTSLKKISFADESPDAFLKASTFKNLSPDNLSICVPHCCSVAYKEKFEEDVTPVSNEINGNLHNDQFVKCLTVEPALTFCKGKSPTCVEDGWKDFYQCSEDGNYFEDIQAFVPISNLEDWKIGPGKLPANPLNPDYHCYDHNIFVCDYCGKINPSCFDSTINRPPNSNEVKDITDHFLKNDFNAKISTDLTSAVQLSDEEKDYGVYMFVWVREVEATQDRIALFSSLADSVQKCFAVDVVKIYGADSPEKISYVKETNNPIAIEMDFPDDCKVVDKCGYHDMARNHEGNSELIQASFNAAKNKINFSSDKFSDYAILFSYEKIYPNGNSDNPYAGYASQTMDFLPISSVLLFSILFLIISLYIKKTRYKCLL